MSMAKLVLRPCGRTLNSHSLLEKGQDYSAYFESGAQLSVGIHRATIILIIQQTGGEANGWSYHKIN